ncbi:hypothetical protein SO802_010004 [Lithocarpus litseifolius]|uniref:Nucleotide-diphospho-sugar transferase domain-containing protein n=1 Tax=Lithocarpus litseifolius TaxID=425828 RepID=A0AAW2DDK8_9ROSI
MCSAAKDACISEVLWIPEGDTVRVWDLRFYRAFEDWELDASYSLLQFIQIRIPRDDRRGTLCWRLKCDDKFDTRSYYQMIRGTPNSSFPWKGVWKPKIHKQKHQDKLLVIAEDYATLFKVNQRWPGHAVLVPPAPDSQTAHKFGSQGFFNFTSRRPRHLLHILELGYNVMYNDVDMVWLADPFPYLQGSRDVYFTDDMAAVDLYLLPQAAFPTGGLYFKNKTWVQETKGMHVIIHNNHITAIAVASSSVAAPAIAYSPSLQFFIWVCSSSLQFGFDD